MCISFARRIRNINNGRVEAPIDMDGTCKTRGTTSILCKISFYCIAWRCVWHEQRNLHCWSN